MSETIMNAINNPIGRHQTSKIPEWVLRHDETVAEYPAITRAAKQLTPILLDKLSVSYVQTIFSIDLLHESLHAAEITACAASLNIEITNAIARYAAIRTVFESLRTNQSKCAPWDECLRWRLLLQSALVLDLRQSPNSTLHLTWIEAARSALLKTPTASRFGVSYNALPYDCFDVWTPIEACL